MVTKRIDPTADLAADISKQILAAGDRTVPTMRKIRRAATRRMKTLEPGDVFRLALSLLTAPGVPKWLPYELVHHHRGAMLCLNRTNLQRLGQGLGSWGEVDPFACYLSGPAWRDGRIADEVVHGWAFSSDRWWRRVAVVSTVALNNTARGGTGDAVRTLAVCDLVKRDRDDMVVKALSWALRELARKEPKAVGVFLSANKAQLAARVLREVRNKLKTGLKNPRGVARSGRRTNHGA